MASVKKVATIKLKWLKWEKLCASVMPIDVSSAELGSALQRRPRRPCP